MRPWWTLMLLSSCLADLPHDGDFSAAARACQGVADYGVCLAEKECAAQGLLLCGGVCVPSDANNCGGCGKVCTGGQCANDQCVSCRLELDTGGLTPIDGNSAVLTCSHLPAGKRVTATMRGALAAGSIGGQCRNPSASACGHWRFVVDVGEHVQIPGNACTAGFDTPMPADLTAQHVPVPADGIVRVWVKLDEVTIASPGSDPCHSNANLSDIELAVEVEY